MQKFWMWVMVKAALRLGFREVSVYQPSDDDNSPVDVIHFATSEEKLIEACKKIASEE